MNSEKFEQKIRDYLKAEVSKVEPTSQWWANTTSFLDRTVSSPSFRERLSAMLTKPAFRAAISVTAVLIVVGTLWGTGVFSGFGSMPSSTPPEWSTASIRPVTTTPQPSPAPSTTATSDNHTPDFRVGASTPPVPQTTFKVTSPQANHAYKYGQEIDVTITITNADPTPQVIERFPAAVGISSVFQTEGTDWFPYSFPSGTDNITLAPGKSISFTVKWDQRNHENLQVPYGWYNFDVSLRVTAPPTLKNPTYLKEIGTIRVVIQPKEGVLQKTMTPNLTATSNHFSWIPSYYPYPTGNVTMTLKRLEFSQTKLKIEASWNISLIKSDLNLDHGYLIAEYIVDGVSKRKSLSSFKITRDGETLVWDYLDPVPKNAKELIFRLEDQVGGPWEFRIKLQ